MSNAATVARQLRQLASEVEALNAALPKPMPTAEKLLADVARLLEQGYTVESALLPARLRHGGTDEYRQAVERLKAAVRELKELGEELGRG